MSEYPINSADLSRRLLGRELRGDGAYVERVRRKLREFGCPRAAGSHRPAYLVDEAMAERVERVERSLTQASRGYDPSP